MQVRKYPTGSEYGPSPVPSISATPTPVSPAETGVEEAAGRSATLKCLETMTDNFRVYRKQTFAFDFEPFKQSCFVTSFDPEYGDNPPLESNFAIYKDGKRRLISRRNSMA